MIYEKILLVGIERYTEDKCNGNEKTFNNEPKCFIVIDNNFFLEWYDFPDNIERSLEKSDSDCSETYYTYNRTKKYT